MKIKQANAGALTNFEVLNFLRSRGASSDPLACLGAVAPSECEVFDYLVHTATCNQSREAIDEFLKRSEKFKLAKAEILNIINLRPSSQATLFPVVESFEERLSKDEDRGIEEAQELVDVISEVLPDPPQKPEVNLNQNETPMEET